MTDLTVTIILPSGYKTGFEFAQDCGFRLASIPTPADGEAHAEIQRLQDAKRRALKVADERAKENVALREALNAIIDASQSFRNSMPKDWEGDPLQDAINAASALTHAPAPTSEGVREVQDIRWAVNVLLEKIAEKFEGWDTHDIWRSDAAMVVRGFKHAAPEPADPPDEGPDPLGYAKGERA